MALGVFFKLIILCFTSVALCYAAPSHIDPYLMPENHPAKPILDEIFSKSRAILNMKSMVKAGFIDPYPRKFTRLVVTKHPLLEGYIIKTYLDAQRYYKKKPEHHYWILRIQGAQAIRDAIEKNGWQEHFKVPHKWVYPLPETPAPPKEFLAKKYLLVEEDMQLRSQKENKTQWRSETVTFEWLDRLFQLLDELGLHDCASIDNIPFSIDGRVAFIDTQTFHRWPVDYDKLKHFLSDEMKIYWSQLAKNKKTRE